MTYAFLSYKSEDEARVGRIARALENAGIDLWWDRSLVNAESWHETIAEKLSSACCVIVVWSEGSVGPEGGYVRDEARNGLARRILVPVLIDRVKSIPLGFGELQAIDLASWKGDPRNPFFQDLIATVRAKLGGEPSPIPKGPKARLARRLIYGAISTTGLGLLSALAINVFGVASTICTVPGPQPALSDACGAFHFGGRPSREERLDWQSLPKGNCQTLRGYVARHPSSPYRNEAADLITAGERGGPWTNTTRQVPIYVAASDGVPVASEAAARSDALRRGEAAADQMCRPIAAGTIFRYVSATATPIQWSCVSAGGGVECGFEGSATCDLQAQTERCG